MRVKFFGIVLLAVLHSSIAFGQYLDNAVQGMSNDGRDFYLGMLYPSYNTIMSTSLAQYFQVFAFVTTYYDNRIGVSYFDDAGNEVHFMSYQLPAKQTLKIPLNISEMRMNTSEEQGAFRSCHITSKAAVTVQYFSTGACSGGSYLSLPTPGLGKKYVVASYNDNPGGGAYFGAGSGVTTYENAGGEFEIIATEDFTNVTITPMATTIGGHVGVRSGFGANGTPYPYTIQLSRGECYLVRSDGSNADADISGSIVETTKPVAVIAGHENAYIGGVGDNNLEGRDFMIEQMVPVELWDSVNFSSIPMKEGSPPGDEGSGDNYRIYTYDTTVVHVHADIADKSGGVDMLPKRFNTPIPEQLDVTVPVNFSTTDGKKISVMQYDERSQPGSFPYPAPSMMTVVPQSRWKYSYNFYVPGNEPFPTDQDYYINVESNYGTEFISFTFNGGNVQSLSKMSKAGGFNSVTSAQYKLYPGTYHFFSSVPFMIYSYGMRAVSLSSTIGTTPGSDFFSEYALPAGMKLATGVKPMVTIQADDLCNSWHVSIYHITTNDEGLKEIFLLDDPDAVYYSIPNYNYQDQRIQNVSFDASLDPSGNGYFRPNLNSQDSFSFDVKIINPLLNAIAPIVVIDNGGNASFLVLQHVLPNVSYNTVPTFVSKPDSIVFPSIPIGQQLCKTFFFINSLDSGQYYSAWEVNSANIKDTSGIFSIKTSRTLPADIYSNNYYRDSLFVTVCFTPRDSLPHFDTLLISSDCFSIPISIETKGLTGIINAGDLDFGSVQVGDTVYKDLVIKNIGGAPFTLLNTWQLSGSKNFRIDPNSASTFPDSIKPDQAIVVKAAYLPQTIAADSAKISWTNDLTSAYSASVKNYSILRGKGISSLAIRQHSKTNTFAISPNPASGSSITISFSSPISGKLSIAIFDVLGREIYRKDVVPGISQIEIPTGNFGEGMYYVLINSSTESISRSFVKVQ